MCDYGECNCESLLHLIHKHELVHVVGTYVPYKFLELLYLLLCQLKLFLVELVMGRYSSGVVVHDLLHGLLYRLVCEHLLVSVEEMVILFYLSVKCSLLVKLRIKVSLVKLLYHGNGRYLSLNHRTGHILLWTSARHISGCEQSAYCGLSVVVHPVTARRVAADYIRLCALYLHILLTRILAGLKPFESLARSHVEVCPLQ